MGAAFRLTDINFIRSEKIVPVTRAEHDCVAPHSVCMCLQHKTRQSERLTFGKVGSSYVLL